MDILPYSPRATENFLSKFSLRQSQNLIASDDSKPYFSKIIRKILLPALLQEMQIYDSKENFTVCMEQRVPVCVIAK